MAFREIRRLLLIVAGIGLPMGFVAGYGGVPRTTAYGLILAFGAAAGLGTYWYVRRMKDRGEYDERHESIQESASTYTLAVLYSVLFPLALAVILFDPELPLGVLLLGVLVGSVVLDEVFVEWFRRRR